MQNFVVDVLGRGFVSALTADKLSFTPDSNKARVFSSLDEVKPHTARLARHGRIFLDPVKVEVRTIIRRDGKPQELRHG